MSLRASPPRNSCRGHPPRGDCVERQLSCPLPLAEPASLPPCPRSRRSSRRLRGQGKSAYNDLRSVMQLGDINLLDRDVFARGGVPHEWFTYLRQNQPVFH